MPSKFQPATALAYPTPAGAVGPETWCFCTARVPPPELTAAALRPIVRSARPRFNMSE